LRPAPSFPLRITNPVFRNARSCPAGPTSDMDPDENRVKLLVRVDMKS
jgi:hypothetical protein